MHTSVPIHVVVTWSLIISLELGRIYICASKSEIFHLTFVGESVVFVGDFEGELVGLSVITGCFDGADEGASVGFFVGCK